MTGVEKPEPGDRCSQNGTDREASGRWNRLDALFLSGFLVLSAVFTASLWRGEWFPSHEYNHQLTRLFEFSEALRGGQFPVRWCPNLMAGHGFPFFNFYAPLAFYAASVFHLAGFSLTAAWKLEFLFARWIGAIGVYGLLRPHARRFGASVGTLLYLFAPYHAVTLFVRGNAAEFTALNVWPLAFWAVDSALRRADNWRGNPAIPAGALALGALGTAHTLTGYLGGWNLAIWSIFLLLLCGRRNTASLFGISRRFFLLLGFGSFGLAVAAFYVIGVAAGLPDVGTHVLHERTQYASHFVQPLQLLLPQWGYGLSVPGPDDGMDFQLGIALWIGLIAAGAAIRKSSNKALLGFALSMSVLHLFGTTALSKPLWHLFPAAPYLQFPWRLLIPAAFWASAAGGLAAGALADRVSLPTKTSWALGAAILSIPVLLCLPYVRPQDYEQAPIYDAERLRLVMMDTAEGEYLPRWVESVPKAPSSRTLTWTEGSGAAVRLSDNPLRAVFEADAESPSVVAYPVFYFPGWKVTIDGRSTEPFPLEPWGFVAWEQPAGAATVEVRWGETASRRAGNLVSAVAIVGALVWLLVLSVTQRARKAAAQDSPPST